MSTLIEKVEHFLGVNFGKRMASSLNKGLLHVAANSGARGRVQEKGSLLEVKAVLASWLNSCERTTVRSLHAGHQVLHT